MSRGSNAQTVIILYLGQNGPELFFLRTGPWSRGIRNESGAREAESRARERNAVPDAGRGDA